MSRIGFASWCCLLLVTITLPIAGCGPQRASGPATSKAKAEAEAAAQKEAVTEVEDQLRSAIYQLQPENLNIDSRLDDAVSVLNNWWAAVQAAKLLPTEVQPPAIPEDRLPAELLTSLQRETFSADDGRYIRDCFLARRISEHIAPDAQGDVERATAVFDWVCRNVALRLADEPKLPLTFYETMVTGRGRPEDRAATAAAILKQLRIDSVILRPQADKGPDAPWLFGVLLDREVYLFDPALGLPIPQGDADRQRMFRTPASLKQLREHPEWLKALSPRADQPYPWSAAELANVRIDVITNPRGWTPRIWSLEQLLPGEALCALYDAPVTTEQWPGVFDRAAEGVTGITADKVGVWNDPLVQAARLQTPDAALQRALQAAFVPFIAPIEFKVDEETGQLRRTETMGLLRFRTDELFGRRSQAIAEFMTIRQLSVSTPPEPALGPVYQRAADDAFYWSCVCKAELGEFESAVKSLEDYLKRYRRGGNWVSAARSLLGDCYYENDQAEQALQVWRSRESDDPYAARHAVLARLWSSASKEMPQPAAEPENADGPADAAAATNAK